MRPLIEEVESTPAPQVLAARFRSEKSLVLLRTHLFESAQARYSFVAARPFLVMRSHGSRCELMGDGFTTVQYGNPWHVLDSLMARYELLDEVDLPFPLGGCFGFWGFGLKNFVEPKLTRRAVNDLEIPDCEVGFYDSLVVFDHQLNKAWIVSTGLGWEGSRSDERARTKLEFWRVQLAEAARESFPSEMPFKAFAEPFSTGARPSETVMSNLAAARFLEAVDRAQRYIYSGDIYQVNLSHRLEAPLRISPWELYQRLAAVSPAPFSGFLQNGDHQIVSSSPELFLRLSGSHIMTRPIKGTRPRSSDLARDAQWNYELQTSPKEMAELVMITDLLRNDLGRVCEFGSVQVPELVRLERYPQVQHLVSTVEGRLRSGVTHFHALASCFPGGSITGAPKIRAMEIIDELEPLARGPYTGVYGYLGFNRESQLSILIRTAFCQDGRVFYNVGAGIVADSKPLAEYEETLAKAAGFLSALNLAVPREAVSPETPEPSWEHPPAP